MFQGCSSKVSIDLSNFNTSFVMKSEDMFDGCSSLISLELKKFNALSVNNMITIFY